MWDKMSPGSAECLMGKRMIEFLLTAFGAAIGYFGRRFVEKSGRTEEIDRKAKLLDLHERMSRGNVTIEALTSFEEQLLSKTRRLRTIEDRLLPSPSAPLPDEDAPAFQTQAEMNQHAADRFAHAERELAAEVEAVEAQLDGDAISMFTASHKQWLKYRQKQAELAASFYEGGSMQPLIHFGEMERLTISRIAEIQDFLQNSREMIG